MRDPIVFYTRLIEDLERISAPILPERLDPVLWYEIKEAKEELTRLLRLRLQGQTQTVAEADGLTLVPAIRKCYRCGKTITMTKECNHRTAISQ